MHGGFRLCLTLCSLLHVTSLHADDSHLTTIIRALNAASEDVQLNMLSGMLKGLEGAERHPAPDGWDELNRTLSASDNPHLRNVAADLNRKFGDPQALQHALALLADPDADVNKRRAALAALVRSKEKRLRPQLEPLLKGPLKLEAIRAFGVFDDDAIPAILLKQFSNSEEPHKRAILETLTTRKAFALKLTGAIADGRVQKKELPAYLARNLNLLLGKTFTDVYGASPDLSREKTKVINSYRAKFTEDALKKADVAAGRVVYERSCGACHKLYDTGGEIGPELTGSNRADLDYILLNIIDPGFDIPEAYRLTIINTRDGKTLAGIIGDEDEHTLQLVMVDTRTSVKKSEILTRETSKASMMPEGLLSTLKDKEVVNLIRYLQTDKQVPLP